MRERWDPKGSHDGAELGEAAGSRNASRRPHEAGWRAQRRMFPGTCRIRPSPFVG